MVLLECVAIGKEMKARVDETRKVGRCYGARRRMTYGVVYITSTRLAIDCPRPKHRPVHARARYHVP